jgi:hypothetical protein
MPLSDPLLNIGANAMAAAATHLSLHTAQPASPTSGTNESTAGRVAAAWPGAVTGDLSISNKAFTGGAANGPCTHVGFWSAVSGGTFHGYVALSGDQTFNSAGEYTITSLTVNGSST